MNPGPGRSCAVMLVALLLSSGTLPVRAQSIGIESPAPATALGDTVELALRLDTGHRRLTSVGLALAFDPDLLEPLTDADGVGVFAPEAALRLGATVYENAVHPAGAGGAAQARFVAVADPAVDGERSSIESSTLARIRFRVVGHTDSLRVAIVPGGRHRPVFTEAGQPGVEQSFGEIFPALVTLPLGAEGFLPLNALEVEAGRVAVVGLSGRTTTSPVRWIFGHPDSDLIGVEASPDSLWLTTRPRTAGVVDLDYEVTDASGSSVGAGTMPVRIHPGPERLVSDPLSLDEDVPLRVPVAGFLLTEGEAAAFAWRAHATPPLEAGIDGDDLWLRAPPDWYGEGSVALSVFAGRDWLDSLRIPLAVSAVNDPPRLHLPTTPVRAVVGAPVRGPSLDDIIDDGDDDLAELSISVRGDSGATVWIEDGHIHVRGQRTGPATAELFVVDPAGDTAVGRLSIEVSAPTAAPRLLGAPVPQLAAGDTLRLAMADWIADDDTPLESLSVSLEVAGAVIAAHRDGDSLRVVSGASGTGHVLLTLSDEDGNQTSTAWVFEVSDVVAVDAPPAGDAPPSVLSQRFAHKVV